MVSLPLLCALEQTMSSSDYSSLNSLNVSPHAKNHSKFGSGGSGGLVRGLIVSHGHEK